MSRERGDHMMMMMIIRGFRLSTIPVGRLNGWPRHLFRPLCSSSSNSKAAAPRSDEDAYRQVQNLDFMTAAKILFTTPPKEKKFGLDFHLVQLFFACMPSLAVYLVAQYARYEIRRMEAEVEQKKKAEEEKKAKEMESNTMEEEGSDSELFKVKVRLDALEETVKEIADETKKLSSGSITKDQESSKKEQPTNPQSKSRVGDPILDASGEKVIESNATATATASQEHKKQKGKIENKTTSQ